MPDMLSIREAAQILGVSDDLMYELTARGEMPCLRFGRRKVIPRRAIELLVESALEGFEPEAAAARLTPVIRRITTPLVSGR